MGPLIPLFSTSGDVCPGFQSQGGPLAYFLACVILREVTFSDVSFLLFTGGVGTSCPGVVKVLLGEREYIMSRSCQGGSCPGPVWRRGKSVIWLG